MENKFNTNRIIISTIALIVTIILFVVLYQSFYQKDELTDLELTFEEQKEYADLVEEIGVSPDVTVAQLRKVTQAYLEQYEPQIKVDSPEFDDYLRTLFLENNDHKQSLITNSELAKVNLYLEIYFNDQGLGEPLGQSELTLVEKDSDTLEIILKRQIIAERDHNSEQHNYLSPTVTETSK